MLTMLRLSPDPTTNHVDETRLPLPTVATSMCRLATGRSAIFYLISKLSQLDVSTVLMPSYVAEGVIKPFRAAGYKICFYRLNPDLTPHFEDVSMLLMDAKGTAVIVLIHYFGFSAWTDPLRATLAKYRAVILEDCAHALLTTTDAGVPLAEHADVALYSLNKFLPVTDGAILVSRREDIDVSMDTEVLPDLPAKALDAYGRHLVACRALYECASPQRARALLKDVSFHYENYYAVINNDLAPHHQSKVARKLEDAYPYGWCTKRRRDNARYFYDHVKSNVIKPVHSVLPNGVVPFAIPALVTEGRREKVLELLFERGVMLSTLEDKWNFVPDDREAFFAFEMSFLKDHVLVPVSEFISHDEIKKIIHEINRI